MNSRVPSIVMMLPLAFWPIVSVAAEKAGIPEEAPEWWTGDLGEEGEAIWDQFRADGKITPDEVLEKACAYAVKERVDVSRATARLLAEQTDDPVPALGKRMRDQDLPARLFIVNVAGELGDIRLEPEIDLMIADKAKLDEPLAEWWGDETVSDVARTAFDRLLDGGIHGAESKLPRPSWLKLRSAASPALKESLSKMEESYDEAMNKAQADYRRRLAEAISHATEIEVFLLDFKLEKADVQVMNWQNNLPRDRFPIVPYGKTSVVLGRKRLEPAEVERLMPLLKATVGVEENWFGAMCHFPVHGVRISNGGQVVFQTSICYGCANFYMEYPYGAAWTGLAVGELKQVMEELMPIPESLIKRFEKEEGGPLLPLKK